MDYILCVIETYKMERIYLKLTKLLGSSGTVKERNQHVPVSTDLRKNYYLAVTFDKKNLIVHIIGPFSFISHFACVILHNVT